MILFDWFCGEHGDFEGSHPICPHLGCQSKEVIKTFKKAPGFKSDMTKRTDAGLRNIATRYGMPDILSARAGEVSMPKQSNNAVLWGSEAQDFLGKPMTQAHTEASFKLNDGKVWTDKGGMRTVAEEIGITSRVLPPAEVTKMRKEQ